MTYAKDMPTATDTALASALRLSVMRLARRMRVQRADTTLSLSLSQLAALSTLERHGGLAPGELAAHEKVQPPSMTRIVGALEQSGLVGREPHPTDGRQVVVTVTAAGQALLREERRRKDAWLAQRLHSLDERELGVLRDAVQVLDRLADS
jgi:DNA-binding MarR family transcriptional regulator